MQAECSLDALASVTEVVKEAEEDNGTRKQRIVGGHSRDPDQGCLAKCHSIALVMFMVIATMFTNGI